jgi:hypothetical protein
VFSFVFFFVCFLLFCRFNILNTLVQLSTTVLLSVVTEGACVEQAENGQHIGWGWSCAIGCPRRRARVAMGWGGEIVESWS